MRKRIKRYQWGGTSTWSPYITPQNNASNTYMGIMGIPDYSEQLKNFSSNLNRRTDNLINMYADAGDLFSMKLRNDRSTSKSISDIKAISDMSSGKPAQMDSGGKGMSSGLQKGLGMAGGIISSAYDAIPTLDEVHNENDATTAKVRSTANQALLSGAAGPWGMLAGAINTAIDKTGGFTDASQGLGGGIDTLNSIASLALPGAGWFTKKTIDYKVSDVLKQSGASYGGTLDKANTAAQNAGAKLLFGRSKANSMIAAAKLADLKVNNIMDENQLVMDASNNPLIGIGTQFRQSGGYQHNGVRSGKSGLKMDRDFAKRVVKLSKGKKSKIQKIQEEVRAEEVAGFKNGGAVNVIPDGALHKNRHHLEDVDEKFEEVTTKGIPVITEGDGITQHAEVEREEIIFNLDVTKQLEKLMEDGSDEAAIEAGKLLVHEILENTVDNTGLINKVE